MQRAEKGTLGELSWETPVTAHKARSCRFLGVPRQLCGVPDLRAIPPVRKRRLGEFALEGSAAQRPNVCASPPRAFHLVGLTI